MESSRSKMIGMSLPVPVPVYSGAILIPVKLDTGSLLLYNGMLSCVWLTRMCTTSSTEDKYKNKIER